MRWLMIAPRCMDESLESLQQTDLKIDGKFIHCTPESRMQHCMRATNWLGFLLLSFSSFMTHWWLECDVNKYSEKFQDNSNHNGRTPLIFIVCFLFSYPANVLCSHLPLNKNNSTSFEWRRFLWVYGIHHICMFYLFWDLHVDSNLKEENHKCIKIYKYAHYYDCRTLSCRPRELWGRSQLMFSQYSRHFNSQLTMVPTQFCSKMPREVATLLKTNISIPVAHFWRGWFSQLPVWWDMDEPFPKRVAFWSSLPIEKIHVKKVDRKNHLFPPLSGSR